MVNVICNGDISDIAKQFAEYVADSLCEHEVEIRRGRTSEYELHFRTTELWFKMDRVAGQPGNDTCSMLLELVRDMEIVWYHEWSRVPGSNICFDISSRRQNGFELVDGSLLMWGSYSDIGDEPDWGDGSDIEVYPEEQIEDSPETSYGGEAAVQPSIVPPGITQIRVVALKYNGSVIAFRFKTDKGAFDMRKTVAAGFGLGEFKTETFITLKSVNGMLMSESEHRKKVCVPDVSDCTEDCAELMRILMG